jgi:menaquinone-dependent protoporphyrinogen IX oxidase
MKRQEMIKKQKQAIEYIQKFIANSKHDESTCCVFDGVDTTEKNNLFLNVQMYLGTWVLPHMIDVLNELENGA